MREDTIGFWNCISVLRKLFYLYEANDTKPSSTRPPNDTIDDIIISHVINGRREAELAIL